MRAILIAIGWTAGFLAVIVAWRRIFAAPMPRIFDPILNTRFRRRNFAPEVAANRHGLEAGMRVLEIGPAGGYLTAVAQSRVQPGGSLIAIDLQRPLLERLRTRLGSSAPPLVCGDATKLPFRNASFDLLFVVEVMGEIPDRAAALSEFRRVLRAGGILAVSEAALFDPDYVRFPVLMRLATAAGFEPRETCSERFQYTQRFVTPVAHGALEPTAGRDRRVVRAGANGMRGP